MNALVRPDLTAAAEVDWLGQAGAAPVLALDPGVRTGWAWSDGTTGLIDLSDAAKVDHGQALAAFHDALDAMLTARRARLLVIERAFFSRGGLTVDLTRSVISVAHMVGWSHAVGRREEWAADARDWLLGGRKARRGWPERRLDAAVREAVEARGFRLESEHAADAAALVCLVERRAVPV